MTRRFGYRQDGHSYVLISIYFHPIAPSLLSMHFPYLSSSSHFHVHHHGDLTIIILSLRRRRRRGGVTASGPTKESTPPDYPLPRLPHRQPFPPHISPSILLLNSLKPTFNYPSLSPETFPNSPINLQPAIPRYQIRDPLVLYKHAKLSTPFYTPASRVQRTHTLAKS